MCSGDETTIFIVSVRFASLCNFLKTHTSWKKIPTSYIATLAFSAVLRNITRQCAYTSGPVVRQKIRTFIVLSLKTPNLKAFSYLK